MRSALLLSMLALAVCAGCTSQACRPCGPGFLGNKLIPQRIADVDFRDACYQHDHCYGTDCPRKQCDVNFRDEMLCACQCSSHPALCRMQAWKWYWLTRVGGGPAHRISQRDRTDQCECCEEGSEPANAALNDLPADDLLPTAIE